MKTHIKIVATIGALAFSNFAHTDPITDTYNTGDILTTTTLENIKSAVNSNDANITTNSSDISTNATDITANTNSIGTNTTSIASLNALVTSLQTKIDSLEAQNIGVNAGDLVGKIFCFINLGTELTGGANPGVYTSHVEGIMTFTSSTQLSFLNGSNVDAFLDTNTGVIGTGSVTPGTSTTFNYSLTENILTVAGLGSENFFLTPDGNLLVGDLSGLEDAGNNHFANFTVAVRAGGC